MEHLEVCSRKWWDGLNNNVAFNRKNNLPVRSSAQAATRHPVLAKFQEYLLKQRRLRKKFLGHIQHNKPMEQIQAE